MLEDAPVDQHLHLSLPIPPAAAIDMASEGLGLVLAPGQHRILLPQSRQHPIVDQQFLILPAPGVRSAVKGVGIALDPRLVAVVDAGHAGHGELEEGEHFQSPAGQVVTVIRQTVQLPLKLGKLLLLRGLSQRSEDPLPVVAADDVEGAVEVVPGVVFLQAHEPGPKPLRVQLAQHEVDSHRPEGVVHGGLELFPQQILPLPTVALLVGGVLPYLAQQDAVRCLLLHGRPDALDKLVGQLVSHVQPPAADALTQPVADDAVSFAVDELAVAGLQLLHIGQVGHSPPALVVVRPMTEAIPFVIGGVLALAGAHRIIVAQSIEIPAVRPGVAEHPVQDDADVQLPGRIHQGLKAVVVP